jgi:hypothetical protein
MVRIFKEQKAKQGRSGARILIVLIAGLILALAVWSGVEFYGEAIEAGTTAATPPAQ